MSRGVTHLVEHAVDSCKQERHLQLKGQRRVLALLQELSKTLTSVEELLPRQRGVSKGSKARYWRASKPRTYFVEASRSEPNCAKAATSRYCAR